MRTIETLKTSWLETPLGTMQAIASHEALFFLDFADSGHFERTINRFKQHMACEVTKGRTPIMDMIEDELRRYFSGKLTQFKTPLIRVGSPFQKAVWSALQAIPYGSTISYAQLAQAVDKPTAWRAVANANGCNPLAIVIPCHRVIRSGGQLGGYGGGLPRKRWLLSLETKG